MKFLVVEFAGGDLPFSVFTEEHPGATADLVVEAIDPRRSGPHTRHETLFMLKGAPWSATEAFVRSLSVSHGIVHTLRRDPEAGIFLGRVGLRFHAIPAKVAKALAGLLRGLGSPWIHCSGGVLHMRVRVPEPEPAGLIEGAEAALAFAHVEAQAELREFSPHDYSVWQELLEQSVGLAP